MSKSNSKHAPKTWYRLDLSAIVYPTLQRRDFSSVYRLSVLLKDPVQPDILQQAVDIAMKPIIPQCGKDFSGAISSRIPVPVRL